MTLHQRQPEEMRSDEMDQLNFCIWGEALQVIALQVIRDSLAVKTNINKISYAPCGDYFVVIL